MANQTFKVVGITVHNGNAKVRFTDDMARRIKQFSKGGATRCDFIELPEAMTKLDALRYMKEHEQFQSAEDQATIAESIEDRAKETRKGEVKVKVAKTKTTKEKVKPSLDAIKKRARKDTTAEDVLSAVASEPASESEAPAE